VSQGCDKIDLRTVKNFSESVRIICHCEPPKARHRRAKQSPDKVEIASPFDRLRVCNDINILRSYADGECFYYTAPPTPQFWGEITHDSPQGWGARGASA